jgi:ATP-dependent helicase HrpA
MSSFSNTLSKDQARLHRLRANYMRNPSDEKAASTFSQALKDSESGFAKRLQNRPAINIDENLPVGQYTQKLLTLLEKHQVLIVAGETGSGKTTQLPKICLAAGRGIAGMIGCTQPRRIAARAVAKRVADELNNRVGDAVGYQVRFTEQVGEQTYLKFMTDGILLSEIQSDPWLSKYDTLIIDEAHERSLNIDFLLGFLKKLIQKRKDLKLIITSATIDTDRFSKHFDNAPVLSVAGRGFPVEVRYRDFQPIVRAGIEDKKKALLELQDDLSMVDKIIKTVDEISLVDGLGDILIFLTGEREIRDTHLALSKRQYRSTEVLALYARLSVKDQDRVFNPGAGRRIVLATNVAETSLTVPRIRYVIDPGLARIKRYSARQKLDRLLIEPISQASANQRKGRCGRVSAGICYRLYAEVDFKQRPAFTDPEIKRAALAGVILRMLSLKLGALEQFPFIDMPDSRAISDGWQTLTELGAIDTHKALSVIGRQMARLPVDVKLSRMLVAANGHGVLHELLIIASFMGIQDPRERPAEAKQAADAAHQQFADQGSEFLSMINLWLQFKLAHEDLSQSQLRKWCEKNYLSYLRMREWRELHRQLLITCQDLQWQLPAWQNIEAKLQQNKTDGKSAQQHYQLIHRAVLAGLPMQIGHKNDKGQYDAPRQRKFQIFPGSPLAKQTPNWCLVGNLLDTHKVWGMMVARLDPAWVIEECSHLLSKKYFDPHWSRSQGRVVGFCQISMLGLVLAAKKPMHYGGLFPTEARAIFIRQALLTGEINARANFIQRNIQMLQSAQDEEAKQRRVGLVVDEDWQVRWYADRLPTDMCSAESLDKWFKALPEAQKNSLLWTANDLLIAEQSGVTQFPNYFLMGENQLALHYRFAPGEVDDGVTLDIPIHLLNALDEARVGWLVPGLLEEKVSALIRGLPKSLRRNYVPAPDFSRAFCQAYPQQDADSLLGCLARFLSKSTGAPVSALDFNEAEEELDAHLKMNIRLADMDRQILAQSRYLHDLKRQFAEMAENAFSEQAAQWFSKELFNSFPEQPLPVVIQTSEGLQAYPALVLESAGVRVQAFARQQDADKQHSLALGYLLTTSLQDKRKSCAKQLPVDTKLGMIYSSIESAERLRTDCVQAALNEWLEEDLSAIRTKQEFDALQKTIAQQLFSRSMAVLALLERCLKQVAQLRGNMDSPLMGWAVSNLTDIKQHLNRLVYAGFLTRTPAAMLPHLPRYLEALSLRQARALQDPIKDQARMLELKPFVDSLAKYLSTRTELSVEWQHFWQDTEELCVQVFAQELSLKGAISHKRLAKQLAVLT